MNSNKSLPQSIYILIFLILFQGVSGIFGGLFLIYDPSGETLRIPSEWLDNSPFDSYLIPGIILFFVLGVYPLIIVFLLWRKKARAWEGALILGIALLIWIFVEILVIGYQADPPLQLIYGITGLLIIIFTLLPSVRKFYIVN